MYRIGSNFKQVWETMKMECRQVHPIVWQYIIFGYNEHEIETAKEIAHKEGITLLLIKTNRGFDPRSRNLRKNVQKAYNEFKVPSDKNRVKKIKAEEYFNITPELKHWRKVRERTIEMNITYNNITIPFYGKHILDLIEKSPYKERCNKELKLDKDGIPKTIVVSLSGGCDSASALYLTARHFPNIEIYPITFQDVRCEWDV